MPKEIAPEPTTPARREKKGPQTDRARVFIDDVVASDAFRRGVADVRTGRRPRFDQELEGGWYYEWGRLFGTIAPRDLKIVVNGRVNNKAVCAFMWARVEGSIP